MHNWRLLVLLITSLLQPILSEYNAFDGRRCCSHSAHLSLEEGSASLHGKYRHDSRIFRDLHLNTRRDVLRHQVGDERRLERHILTPKDYTQNDNGRQLEISSVQDKTVLKHSDARNRDISFNGRSINVNREILIQSRPTFNTHEKLNHACSEDFGIHDTSKTEKTSSRYLRNSRSTISQRSENGRDSNARYIHKRDLTRDSYKMVGRTRITAERQDLLNNRENERGIWQRDRNIRQIKDKHITSSFSRKLKFLESDGQVSRVRDRIDNRISKKLSRDNIHVNTDERDGQLSNPRQTNKQSNMERIDIRNLNSFVEAEQDHQIRHQNSREERLTKTAENRRGTRDNTSHRKVQNEPIHRRERNTNNVSNVNPDLRDHSRYARDILRRGISKVLLEERLNEYDLRYKEENGRVVPKNIRKVFVFIEREQRNLNERRSNENFDRSRNRRNKNERDLSTVSTKKKQSMSDSLETSLDNEVKGNERIIIVRRSREERYTYRRDKRTEFSSTDRYLRNIQRNARSAAIDMRQLDDDTLPRRRFNLRNEELYRNVREDGGRKNEMESRQIRAQDASIARDMHRLENRQITEIDGTHNQEERNILLRGESDIIRRPRRSRHEVRTRAVSIKSTEERDARSYEVRDNETDEHFEIRKIERHSRDNVNERAISFEREIPRLSSRVTYDRNNRIRQERNALRAMRRHESNVEKDSRTSTREKDLMLPHGREFTLQQNSNVRNEHSRIRIVERYDHSRDRVVERERNNEIPNRMLKRQITWTIEERNTNLKDDRVKERGPNRNTIQMHERNDDLIRSMTTDARTNDKRMARHQNSQIRRTEGNLRTQNIQQSILNRENEPPAYEDSRNYSDMKRDQSRRYTVFSVRTKVGTESETKSSNMFRWQYLFYVIQGLYILDIIMQLFRQKEKYIKSSATSWFTASQHIKME